MDPRDLRIALLCALGAACTVAERPVPVEAAPDAGAAAPLAAAPPALPDPVRPARWAAIEAWMRGQEIDREPTMSPGFSDEELQRLGGRVFALYCANCHGEKGRGDGPRSAVFEPLPRDLARGVYKFRTTPSGRPPTREDLYATISGGLHGTGMPPFADLPEVERWALVAFVRGLAPDRFARERGGPVAAPAVPADLDTPARQERGRETWGRLGCTECHGKRGRGDGPAAATLKDDFGRPLRAPDLATRPLKRGETPARLWMTLATGLDGTPMPSYAVATEDELWDVVAYVRAVAAPGRADARDIEEAQAIIQGQRQQAAHAVVDGCGCQARRAAQQQQQAAQAPPPPKAPQGHQH